MCETQEHEPEPFEIIGDQEHAEGEEVNDLLEGIVYGLDEDGQPIPSQQSDSETVPTRSSQGYRGLIDLSVQAIRFPLEPGEAEPISVDMVDQLARNSLMHDLDLEQLGGHSPQYSQSSSQGSNISHVSLNEDSRFLRYSSFESTSGGLYSPAGSQPSSQTASLPIQYPSSQESDVEASLTDRLQEAAVVPSAAHLYLQQFCGGQNNTA